MKTLTITALLAVIVAFLRGEKSFIAVREFVYEYYESETDCKLDDTLDLIFPVLAPYLEYEEAFGDKERLKKFQNTYDVLQLNNIGPEHVIFALNFDQIMQLRRKFEDQLITKEDYDDQLTKLSPADFNIETVERWANTHKSIASLDASKLT